MRQFTHGCCAVCTPGRATRAVPGSWTTIDRLECNVVGVRSEPKSTQAGV